MCKHGYISYQHNNKNKCEVCIQAKMTKKPFPKVERNSQLLELVHSDICEINGILTRGGKRYFITFINDYSRLTYVYLLRTKDEAFEKFKEFKKMIENKKERQIKVLRSDRGEKYFSKEFSTFCEENRIIHQMITSYTPQHNRLAKRKNRTLVDMVNAMLLNAKLPNN
jgi:transposase InsO family protein